MFASYILKCATESIFRLTTLEMTSHVTCFWDDRKNEGKCQMDQREGIRRLTRAPLGYSAERAPLGGGGGRFCPPA